MREGEGGSEGEGGVAKGVGGPPLLHNVQYPSSPTVVKHTC